MTIAVKDGNGALQTVKTIDDLLALIALASKQDTGNGTLASILAKITADPATATGQAAIIAAIGGIPGGGGGGDASEATLAEVKTAVEALAALIAGGALNVFIDPSSVNANGQATMANSAPVVLASDHPAVPTKESKSATGAQSSVSAATSSKTVLAANANRLGATVFNDSTAILYLLLATGGTASTSAYTVQIAAGGYYEVPFGFTGALIGIWAAANGNARVTELT